PLEVENIFPRIVEDGVIASICIDSLLHFNIEDLDIYVVAPSGQFMELTTDNGGDGGNGNAPDFYRSTCFVADNAANDITTGSAPFIGEWQPEGEFSDLFGSPTNGTWQLLIVDDENDSPIFDGTLFEWSITFSAQYEINYQWSPAAGLSCTDCPNPTANPASTMTYTYAVSDSRGCSETAEVTVSVGGSLPAPVVSCGNISDAEIEITFTDIAGSSGYEVNVDGNGWETPNGNLSHTIMGLLPGQEVTVQVRGINNCGTAEIGSTTCETVSCVVPTVSIDNVIDVTCSSETDGEILVSASGGINGAFNFSLNGETNTTGEFFDLAAGDYQLIVFEAVDCADTLMITINEPAGIVASAMVLEEPLCVGLPGGSASVEVSGGTYPYFYQWTSGETDSIAINLRGGMNEVSIVDANDCEQVIAVDIPEPSPIVVMTSASNVNCNGAADGSIIVSATGGTAAGDYTFLWGENTSFSTNDTILDLAPDVYSLTVTDDNGCTAKAMVTIVEPDVITLSTTSTEASCSGNFDGSATVQVMGGSGDYNFAWNDPNNQTTATANGLTVGEYEVTVTDRAGGCEIVTTANVTSPNAIIVEQQAMATRCVDTSDGSLSLDISGGAGGYSVVWDDNPTTAAMRTDLSAGIYQATVSDAAGCFEIVQVRIPSPDSITYEIFSTQNSCRPQDDGTATINATGGTGNLLYQWDDLQMQQANQAFQLEAGTYSVTVTDERSCEEIASVEVTDAPPIEIMGEAGMPTCFGENTGFAEVMATGGIGELAYQWQGFTNQTANRLSDVPAGTYRVIVSDDVGCQEGFDVIVDQPTELMATTMVIPTSCENTSGDASVTPTGGTEPYTYMWSDAAGQTTSTVTGLDPTTYSVTVTDANGCSIVEMVDVSVPEQLNVNLSSTEASCGGVADGSVTAEPSGGAGGYTYQWSAGIDPTQATIADLPLGNYTVTITDTNGCSVEQTVAIEEAAPFTISSTVTDENCIQDDAGAVNITVNDGVGQLTFQWSNNATTEDIDNLPAGDYFATVTDANGCQVLINATVQPEPEIDLEFAASDVSCNGLSDGTVSVVAQNGNGNYVYQWSDNSTDPIRLGLAAGLYEVEVVDDGGCRALDSIRIQQPDSVLLDISTEPISCYDDRDGLLLVNARGGSPEYTYSLDGQRYGTSNAFINLTAGTYQVVAQDKNSCFSEPMEATIEQPEELTASLEHLLIYQFGDSLQLAPKINGGTGDLIYSWMPVDTTILSCFDCPNPYLRATFQTSVTLTVTDENNCRTNEATNIIVQKDRRIFVPTGFTPNADRTNDILLIHGEPDAKIIIFKVFDRWGELLYEQSAFDISDLKMGWDGNFRGQPAPAGVYVWYMEVEFVDGVRELYKGETTLLR
ncbi:MAG: gliding motility-associated C-terminal domain-containing protein, partial [Saprospiraceae bacterium]